MNEQFEQRVAKAYGEIISSVDVSKPYAVSFDGSQKPYEFFAAWNIIDEKLQSVTEPTFLEIGAYKGLWAVAFFEWCKANNKQGRYFTVTWMEHNPANADLLNVKNYYTSEGFVCKLFDMNSQLESTKELVSKEHKKFDVILIDADHRYEGAKKDIELYASLAGKLLVFHDIRPQEANESCGVYKAIVDSNVVLDHQIACSDNMMGIGIVEIK